MMNRKIRVLLSCFLLMTVLWGTLVSCRSDSGEEGTSAPDDVSETGQPTDGTTAESPSSYVVPEPTGDEHTVIYPLAKCYVESEVATVQANGYDVPLTVGPGVYDYCNFSFDGSVSVTVKVNEPIKSYTVSPLAKGIVASVDGNVLTFTLRESLYVIVKINNLREIIIAADTLETDKPASRGDGIYNVLDYGADPTGKAITSTEINAAIKAANAAGGGIVYVPAGLYTVTNIALQSNVSLYLEGGAVLRAYYGNYKKYFVHYEKNSVGSMKGTWLVYTAPNSENIRVYGRGTIDGNGTQMRNDKAFLVSLLVPHQCSSFRADGVILRDGGLWSTMVIRSDHVDFTNTKHFNENDLVTENDAIDILESQEVTFRHTIAVSEDDAYSLKTYASGNGEIKKSWIGTPEVNENVTFDDCFAWSKCGAFKVGWGFFGSMKNIRFTNSYAYSCMTGINITHYQGTAGAEDILYENIDIENFKARTNSGSPCRWFILEIVDRSGQGTGSVKNVTVRNITVRKAPGSAGVLEGYSDTDCFDTITLENITYCGKKATTLAGLGITQTNSFYKNLTIK